MSTILKTLKKLEEEKSILDRKVDLKELVLKDDLSGVLEEESGSRPWLVAVLVILSFALGAFWVYSRAGDEPRTPPVASGKNLEKSQAIAPPMQKAVLPALPPTGIPLANIPETEEGADPLEAALPWEEDELEIEFENVVQEAALPAPVVETPPVETPPVETPLAREEENAIPVPAEIREIDAIIKSATQAALKAPAEPPAPVTGEAPSGLKVTAIIFFDDESPGNHIFVSTPKAGNLKMTVGDEVENARLIAIAPNRVTFDYQDKTVEVKIGH